MRGRSEVVADEAAGLQRPILKQGRATPDPSALLPRWVTSQRTRLGPLGFPKNDAGPDAKPGLILGASPVPLCGLP